MSRHCYLQTLRHQHRQSMTEAAGPSLADERTNLVLAVTFASAAWILFYFNGYRTGFQAVHRLGIYFSWIGVENLSTCGETLPALCLLALLARRGPRVLWMAVLASAYAGVITYALKHLFNASRPPAILGAWVAGTGPVLRLHSFPSGHTVTAFVLAACFSVRAPKPARFIFYALAAAVGFSRVWLGVHWPIDVIAGVAVAGLSVWLAIKTTKVSNWGLALLPHCLFVLLIGTCALLELMSESEYRFLPLVLHTAIYATSLAVLTKDYLTRVLRTATAASLDAA